MAGVLSGSGGGFGRVGALFAVGSLGGRADADLLELFASGEAAEVAFEALVLRHGPGVLAICRRILVDPNDADDAFQATFLVLARRARSASIGRSESIGPWLRGVAFRIARKARVAAARRRKHEGRAALRPDVGSPRPDEREATLREEVERLPESLRAPVVLCYLENMTYHGAARRLRISEGTIRGRLVKARSLLRLRLSRREDVPPAQRPPRVSPGLAAATIRSAIAITLEGAGRPGPSSAVASLMEGVLTMTLSSRGMIAAAVLVALGLTAVGGGASPADDGGSPAAARSADQNREPPGIAPRADGPSADPRPAPVLTLDAAIGRLLRQIKDEVGRLKIPGDRADALMADLGTRPIFYADGRLVPYGQSQSGRPGGPPQSDINISYPLDASAKRRARLHPAARPRTVAEAWYQDFLRIRIDALYSAYVDVQEIHERSRLRKQQSATWVRLVRFLSGPHEHGSRPQVEIDMFMCGLIGSRTPTKRLQGIQAQEKLHKLAGLVEFGAADDIDRLSVDALEPTPVIPPADDLIRLALKARPDLAVLNLGVARAEVDLETASRPASGSGPVDSIRRPHAVGDQASGESKRNPVDVSVPLPIDDGDRGNIARAEIHLRQTRVQRDAFLEVIRREVERSQKACASGLAELQEVANAIERSRVAYQDMDRRYKVRTALASDVCNALGHLQRLELRRWELLVKHRRDLLSLNTALGVRLFP